MTLQQQFLANHGKPIQYGRKSLIQMDRLPVYTAKLSVKFLRGNSELVCGVALKPAKGYIVLSSGKKVKRLNVWDEAGSEKEVNYLVVCPDGELRIWNIYRIKHKSGLITEDSWTNNACMYVQEMSPTRRKYFCSDGLGDIDLRNHEFELNWISEQGYLPGRTHEISK